MTDSFAFYVSILRKEFMKYSFEVLSEKNITQGQMFVLVYVGKRVECSPKEISTSLKIDAGHLNRTIAKLEENGFLNQRVNEHDRRAKILSLTDKGKEIFKMSYDLFYQWDDRIFEGVTEEEHKELMRIIRKISVNAVEMYRDMPLGEIGEV